MHEMGLIDAVVRTVDRIVKEDPEIEGVNKIVLEVGVLSGVMPDFLRECFEAVVWDTPYEKTELEIEMLPGTLHCNDCNIDFRADPEDLTCPECLGKNLTPMTGLDMTIKEIEVYPE